MPNPFTREQDAFKMLVVFMAGAAIVIAVTLITGSSAAGLAVAFVLVCVAAAKLWVDYTRWRAEQDEG
jgi:VIT1/CCC1 family predicted Fe2+/Mn2+ transporter